MKKIILLFITIFLISCSQELKQNIPEQKNSNKVHYFEKIKSKLSELEKLGISQQDAEFINKQLFFIIERQIEKMALNNLSLCNKTNNYELCIRFVALQKVNKLFCEKLKNNVEKIKCINDVLIKKSQEDLDEKFCLKIIDNTQEKILQKNCKDRVIFKKAILNKDKNLCSQLLNNIEKNLCIKNIKN